MSLRATAAAVIVAVVLWAAVWLTGEREGGQQETGAIRLVQSAADAAEVRVTGESTASLVRRGSAWVIRSDDEAAGPREWPADELGVRELLRMVATAELEPLDEEPATPAGGTRTVTVIERHDGVDRVVELTLSDGRVGAAVAGVVDGLAVRIDAGLAAALTTDALLGLRETAVFERGAAWVHLQIESGEASLAIERVQGVWRLAGGETADIRLDQRAVSALVASLQTLRFERHVEPPEVFGVAGSIRVRYRDAAAAGEVRTAEQAATIGPQADLAGNLVLLHAERESGSIYGEIRTEQLPLLPTEPGPLLDRRAISVAAERVVSIAIVAELDAEAGAATVSRAGDGWSGPRGAFRLAASESLSGLIGAVANDSSRAEVIGQRGLPDSETTLRLTIGGGEVITLALTAERDQILVSDGRVRWRYAGDGAQAIASGVAVLREAIAPIDE